MVKKHLDRPGRPRQIQKKPNPSAGWLLPPAQASTRGADGDLPPPAIGPGYFAFS
jgi:hypothetical protein